MTIEEAETFFKDIPAINDRLETLNATGLQYLTLGQSATTLSGGEAQRVAVAFKIVSETDLKRIYPQQFKRCVAWQPLADRP